MKKLLTITLAVLVLAAPGLALIKHQKTFKARTDRHNNPTAMIWTPRVQAFFYSRGYAVKKGEPFPDTDRYHTLDLTAVADPIKATVEYIDKYGFYAPWGQHRWTHTVINQAAWHRLTYRQKENIIQTMYNHENGTKGDTFQSSFNPQLKTPIQDLPKPKTRLTLQIKKPKIRPPQINRNAQAVSRLVNTQAPNVKRIKKLPESKEKIIFRQAFSDKDVDQYGNIKVFAWTDRFRIGDVITVTARLPTSSQEICIYRGPDRTPKWKTTTNGYFQGTIEHIPVGKFYYIWLEKEKGIQALLTVTRHTDGT